MYKSKNILALIPARAGSKRLPDKNIKDFCGKPLVAWTIKQAKKSEYIDKVIVSTDSKKIANVCKMYGCQIPFLRPKCLSGDEAKSIDVVLHALNYMEKNEKEYDLIMLLQPTSPLKNSGDIDKAVELLFSKNAKSIVSVCKTNYQSCWINTLTKDGCMKNFTKREKKNGKERKSAVFYKLNGAIYLAYSNYIKRFKSFIKDETFAYIMPQERSVDIDNESDFNFGEFLFQNK